ncbi:hypothetical protein ACH47B_19955 [Rhodococcus sp. NPDC019627]|uniref:hypothetical protein n=1 Tax=Rhodococcus TaxID=1827 RepID=UPI00131F660F|nr:MULTISPECIES: hypothetical protein [Rhodococcus]MDV7357702.1 hypothetical protein [Rhodococcus oxybenzonivorans]QHE71087.1 hypothetical protein GFS60_04685 [Rhodococcus sp. WAY2]
MTVTPAGSYHTPNTRNFSSGSTRDGSLPVAYYKPILRMFPPTSETAEKVAMLTVYGLMAAALLIIALQVAGILN